MVGEGMSVRALAAGHIVSRAGSRNQTERRPSLSNFNAFPSDLFHLVWIYLIKVLKPSKTVPPNEDQVFKHRSWWGDISHWSHTTIQQMVHLLWIKHHEEKGQNYYILSLQIYVLQIQGPVWNRHVMNLPRKALINAWIETCNGLVLFWNSSQSNLSRSLEQEIQLQGLAP